MLAKILDDRTRLFMLRKVRERAVPAGMGEFNVVNEVRALTLPTNIKLIINAGARVRRVSD